MKELAKGLEKHQEQIVSSWVDFTLSTYASSRFFKTESDRFANPVGSNIREALTTIFKQMLAGETAEQISPSLEQIIAIRSVQQFTPSQALSPLNAIKHIVRETIAGDEELSGLQNELYDFEFGVDLVLLAGFDIFMKYRERLYQVRVEEIRSGSIILTDSKCPSKMLGDKDKVVPDFLKVTNN